MTIIAQSLVTERTNSFEAGRESMSSLLERFDGVPKIVIAYLTDHHDHREFLAGAKGVLGGDVPLIGCSAQGVMGLGKVIEDGYAAGVMGLGGDSLSVTRARVEEIQEDTVAKGRELGAALMTGVVGTPRVVVFHHDPLCGVGLDLFLEGLADEVSCPIVGGAAAHAFNYAPLRNTYQFFDDGVYEHAAVAFALSGDFTVELGACHGCAPVGIEMTATKSEGNRLIELDGRPAATVWEELTGESNPHHFNAVALSIGVPANPENKDDGYLIRAAYTIDRENGAVFPTAIPEGTEVMLYHRTVENVMSGARQMCTDLNARVAGKTKRAVLGFECGARAKPFLGRAGSLDENRLIQETIGTESAWLGMLAWGETITRGGRTSFHNFTFPLLVIAE